MAQMKSATHALPGKYVVSSRMKTIYYVFSFLGLLAFALGLVNGEPRIWFSFLTSFFFFLNLAMGGLFFTSIQHVSNAGWSVTVRRVMESLTSFLPLAAVAAVFLLFGAKYLYPWFNTEDMLKDPILAGKMSYLNIKFFAIRLIIFFGAWLIFRHFMVGNSLKQDETGDENLTVKNLAVSVGFLLVFAISYSLFSVDAIMSLEPHWYSTIFGVYCFAGLFQAAIAAVILITIYLMHKGLLNGLVNENHLHDLGKYLKGFSVFYAYIGFSQFMLIWYANLPEETFFYLNRAAGGWMIASWSLLIFKFAVPFLLLLPRWAKRTPAHLVAVSVLVLFMEYIDIHWLVYPNFTMEEYLFSWQEVGVFLGFFGLFLWTVTGFLSRHSIVPIRDPRLEESIHHHVTY